MFERFTKEARACVAHDLAALGISLDEVERRAGGSLNAASSGPARLPIAPSARNVLEQALREALRLGARHAATRAA